MAALRQQRDPSRSDLREARGASDLPDAADASLMERVLSANLDSVYEGDTHSRRDYVFIYSGHELGATVKGRYKRHWIGAGDVAASGMPEAYFDLFQDPREESPQLVPLIHTHPSRGGRENRWRSEYHKRGVSGLRQNWPNGLLDAANRRKSSYPEG